MTHDESIVQRQCVRWFKQLQHRDLAPLLFSVPNGMLTSASQARVAVAEGLTSGAADLILLVPRAPYHALCIEMKAEVIRWELGRRYHRRGQQSDNQKAWQKAVEAQGYAYRVCHTLEEFIDTVETYLRNDFRPDTHI